MEWQDEIRALSACGTGRRNSPLKKKLSIIKRLRNIAPEGVDALRADLICENMDRFASEMASSLLASKVHTNEDIKNIVRVTCALASNREFMGLLLGDIARAASRIDDAERYWIAAYYFDLKQAAGGADVAEICRRMKKEPRILFLEYLAENYRDEAVCSEIGRQLEEIGAMDVDRENQRLVNAANALGIDAGTPRRGFKKMIDAEDGEFEYYMERTGALKDYEGGLDARQIRDYITRHSGDAERLDALSKLMRSSGGQKAVVPVLMQLKSNPGHTSSIARILKMAGLSRKTVPLLLREIHETRAAGSEMMANCLLVSELCKFREVPAGDLFALLDHFFRSRNIEAYCMCLGSAGRFLLLDEATNRRAQECIERIKTHRASDIESAHISSCLSKLFSQPQTRSGDPREFLRYFFRRDVFSNASPVWTMLLRNRLALLFVFLHPWDFDDTEFLAALVLEAGLEREAFGILAAGIGVMYGHSKHRCMSLAKLYAELLAPADRDTQADLVEDLLRLEMDSLFRCKLALICLQKASDALKRLHVLRMRGMVQEHSLELDILLFNFCEESGIEHLGRECEDSFDDDLSSMKYL